MKSTIFKFILLSFVLFITSCNNDDDNSISTDDDGGVIPEDPVAVLNTAREESVNNTLTDNGLEKVWRFSQAMLTNDSGTIEITTNFNVRDDEFVFSGTQSNGNLQWRRGNAIDITGSSTEATLLDYYVAPENSSFIFNTDSSTELSALNGDMTLAVINENTLTGSISFTNGRSLEGETIDFTLTTKQEADYAAAPESGLDFSEVTSFVAYNQFAQQHNSGLIGSYSDNSLYITYRNDCSPSARSRTLKYSVDNNTFIDRNDDWNDFFTRKINIINNELILTGGQNIYTYDLDLSSAPTITPHNAPTLSRYTTTTLNDDVYVIGGDLDEVANKLRRINSENGTLEVVANLPTPKVHAGGEFVNDNLYIFSGREAFFELTTTTPTSYIYNVTSGDFTTFQMPVALANSHASRFENLIYIVGDIQEDTDGDGNTDNHDIWMGVYDTFNDQITEISHNLDDSDAFSYVHSMTIFNDSMYVTYGSLLNDNGDPDCPEVNWSIMAAGLN